ncbi:hypothetical protein MBLNU459_g5605t1 [Dothideomycetes sp. NU459]
MGTRSFAQVPPTAATIALNAYIFGYAGHSLVTPHAALKQLWWTDDRIEAKVTRHYVLTQIRGPERDFLDRPLAFGEGLTDQTYMEWILERARRLFLILSVIGMPNHIFSLIDDSLDDDDLPFSLENVIGLELSLDDPDDRLSKKFYEVQFQYLLRQLKEGSHIDYGTDEHIPMEHVHKLPPAVSLQCWDRIHFPDDSETIYLRRKFPFGTTEMRDRQRALFLQDIAKSNLFKHEHIIPVWASYTTGQAGFTLSNFVPEHTLASFIAQREPYQWMRVPAVQRHIIILEWMHCLADALASLHQRGTFHGAIRPSNVLIDYGNRIAFIEVGALRPHQRGDKTERAEILDYAAPETQTGRVIKSHAIESMGGFPRRRQSSSSSMSSSPPSVFSAFPGPSSPSPSSSPMTPTSPTFRNYSRHLGGMISGPLGSPGTSPPSTPGLTPSGFFARSPSEPFLQTSTRDGPPVRPEAIDVFALGAIYLDILTFVVKGKLNEFVKFRSSTSKSDSSGSKTPANAAATPTGNSNSNSNSNSNNNSNNSNASFHANPDKLPAWIELLRTEAIRLGPSRPALKAVPALLDITQAMLSVAPEQRPNAKRARDQIEEALVRDCAMETLCCKSREWEGVGEQGAKMKKTRLRDSVSTGRATTSTGNSGSGSGGSAGGGGGFVGGETSIAERKKQDMKKKRKLSLPWRRRASELEE